MLVKCKECHGLGQHCLAGHSAHPDNWYDCEACKGKGKVEEKKDK